MGPLFIIGLISFLFWACLDYVMLLIGFVLIGLILWAFMLYIFWCFCDLPFILLFVGGCNICLDPPFKKLSYVIDRISLAINKIW